MTQITLDEVPDKPCLGKLLIAVRAQLITGQKFTLRQLQELCGGSGAGISARIRELRNTYKYTIHKERVSDSGLWVYWME